MLDSLFRGHMDNINRLAVSRKLVLAGPFGTNANNYRGIFILDATTPEEVRQMVSVDAAINAGLFEVEIYPWYGSAALPMYLSYHTQVERKKP